MPASKPITGINDLESKFPKIAREADGWDPTTKTFGSHDKMCWKCKKGHTWEAIVKNRTKRGDRCPYCANKKVWKGFNDLKTKFPKIAIEADGWDPSNVLAGHTKALPWTCKEGHTWEAKVSTRTGQNCGCPYCANQKVWKGFNDLKTMFPKIAREADGWDPSNVLAGHTKALPWKCKEGHTWEAIVQNRTKRGDRCPYCANKKVWKGFNDLKTMFPKIAREADGWDPTTKTFGSHDKMCWKCKKGHTWEAKIENRTVGNTDCPYCSNNKVWKGFNDLKTIFPEVAKQADGWDPLNVLPGHTKALPWKCEKGHRWNVSVHNRTSKGGTGCPICAETGFNPKKPAVFYLIEKPGQQKIGISNKFKKRMATHTANGWYKIGVSVEHSGYEVYKIEKKFKQWLRKKIGLVSGTTESWLTKKIYIHSLSELKEKSGIDTSIF
jgi:uncharacterized protein (DUF983 family)/predicted GIY-YIG superfamily endonuclease